MKQAKYYLIIGFFFTSVLGTLSHFLYDWTGRGAVVALFCPVKESTWEHMKLLFFPMMLWFLFMKEQLRETHPQLPAAYMAGNLAGTLSIPVLFYTYSGILGRNVPAADIAIFFICTFLAFRTAWILRDSQYIYRRRLMIYILTGLITLMFFIFTFFPPGIGLFAEP